jgi:hypothetical protein
MKDAASIAKEFTPPGDFGKVRRDTLERRINRYAARLVKAERERCVGIVKANTLPKYVGREAIIEKINTPAKAMEEKR